jgi:hypothetical protein
MEYRCARSVIIVLFLSLINPVATVLVVPRFLVLNLFALLVVPSMGAIVLGGALMALAPGGRGDDRPVAPPHRA